MENQMQGDKRAAFWKKLKICFSREIAIEYKACLYAFCITVFYCAFLLCQGIFQAEIGHMCQFFILAYLVGYLQVYLLHNFDEAGKMGLREVCSMLFCDSLYTACSYLLGWFDRQIWVTGLFFFYMLVAYGCVYLINRLKRNIDTENLNHMLAEYKKKQYMTEEYLYSAVCVYQVDPNGEAVKRNQKEPQGGTREAAKDGQAG